MVEDARYARASQREDIHPLNTPLKSCEALVKLLVFIFAISVLVLLVSSSKPAGRSGAEY